MNRELIKQIIDAIKNKKVVKIVYKQDSSVSDYNIKSREEEIYHIGKLKGTKGTLGIRVFQRKGISKRKNKPEWKTLDINKIERIKPLNDTFEIRNDYKTDSDQNFAEIYLAVSKQPPQKKSLLQKIKDKAKGLFGKKQDSDLPSSDRDIINKYNGNERLKSMMKDKIK